MTPGGENKSGLAIDVTGITKRFGDKTVVDSLNLKVKQGEIFGFLGPNGSGKTTFIRMLCGLLTPDSGQGTCLGYDVRTDQEMIKRKSRIHDPALQLLRDLTIRENVGFHRTGLSVEGPKESGRSKPEAPEA